MKYILIFIFILTNAFAYYTPITKSQIVKKYYGKEEYIVKRKKGVDYVYDAQYTYSMRNGRKYDPKKTRNLAAVIPYKNGKIHGTIREYDNIDRIGDDYHELSSEINFKNGLAHGISKEYGGYIGTSMYKYGEIEWHTKENDGITILDERYINGKISLKIKYYDSGEIKEKAHFIDGKYHGEHIHYYKNGKAEVIKMWKNDNKEGLTKVYYESGNLRSEINYQDGYKSGLTKTYYDRETLTLKEKTNYRFGSKSGKSIMYHENGKIAFEGNFKVNDPDGKIKTYYQNGQLSETVDFTKGIRDGKHIRYYENGAKGFEINFKNNSIISGFKFDSNGKNKAELTQSDYQAIFGRR